MPRPVCVKCEMEFRRERNGIYVVEMFQGNTQIYKIWQADKWKCPRCGTEIIVGFADKPTKQHFEGDIDKFLSGLKEKGNEIVYDYEL